jgi:hypothetical protein
MSTILYIKEAKGDTMKQAKPKETGYQSRTVKSLARLACWAGAWLAATALMKFGPKFLWNKYLLLTLLAVGVNACMGIGLILAHKRYIAELDELQQRVYLNALGVTVGVVLIAVVPYSVMRTYDVIAFQADISHLLGLMSLTFLVSLLYGSVRYR